MKYVPVRKKIIQSELYQEPVMIDNGKQKMDEKLTVKSQESIQPNIEDEEQTYIKKELSKMLKFESMTDRIFPSHL